MTELYFDEIRKARGGDLSPAQKIDLSSKSGIIEWNTASALSAEA